MLGAVHDMKSFNIRHIQHHLADVERGVMVEVRRRARPVVLSSGVPPRSDRSHAESRLQAVYSAPGSGIAAAETIADGRGDG